jgi:hypothetical protein
VTAPVVGGVLLLLSLHAVAETANNKTLTR